MRLATGVELGTFGRLPSAAVTAIVNLIGKSVSRPGNADEIPPPAKPRLRASGISGASMSDIARGLALFENVEPFSSYVPPGFLVDFLGWLPTRRFASGGGSTRRKRVAFRSPRNYRRGKASSRRSARWWPRWPRVAIAFDCVDLLGSDMQQSEIVVFPPATALTRMPSCFPSSWITGSRSCSTTSRMLTTTHAGVVRDNDGIIVAFNPDVYLTPR